MTVVLNFASISKVLVANRGEIARRVFATCKMRGIGTVAVFSMPTLTLPFVAEADAAVRLPGMTPAETYLRGELIIEAAKRAGADAIHPGYGFLSGKCGACSCRDRCGAHVDRTRSREHRSDGLKD